MNNNLNIRYVYLFLKYVSLLNLKARSYRLICYFLETVNNLNYVKINHGLISKEIGLSKVDVSKGIQELVSNQLLVKDPINITKYNVSLKLRDFTESQLEDLISNYIMANKSRKIV